MKIFRALPILLIPIASSVWLSCADIASPDRNEAYEWRRIEPTGTGTADTFSFYWPRASLPVRVWTEAALNLPTHVPAGLAQWEAAFLYGEFVAEVVSDSNEADIVVRAAVPPPGGLSVTRLASSLAPECQGATDVTLGVGTSEIQRPIRVYVNPRFAPTSPGVDACMALTTTHELGHAIGIFAHSPDVTDIMYVDPTVSALSAADRATAEMAYHTDPSLTVEPR
jgi:predicted Zn-dependent protease